MQGRATVKAVDRKTDFACFDIELPAERTSNVSIGASVAINGTCLTVTQQQGTTLRFDVMAETLRRTNLGALQTGSTVNFERSARVGDEIGGHTVSGHVHSTAKIVKVTDTENNRRLEFEVGGWVVAAGVGWRACAGLGDMHWEGLSRLCGSHQPAPTAMPLLHPPAKPAAGGPHLDEIHTAQGLCVGGRLQPDGGRGHSRRLLGLPHPGDAAVRLSLAACVFRLLCKGLPAAPKGWLPRAVTDWLAGCPAAEPGLPAG